MTGQSSISRKVHKELKEAKCEIIRRHSHDIYYSPITQRTFAVPANFWDKGIAYSIEKLAGIKGPR